MRLDKFLKISHIVKRRTIAHDFVDLGKALVNGKVAKPSTFLKVGDVVTLNISERRQMIFEVLDLPKSVSLKESKNIYKIISE